MKVHSEIVNRNFISCTVVVKGPIKHNFTHSVPGAIMSLSNPSQETAPCLLSLSNGFVLSRWVRWTSPRHCGWASLPPAERSGDLEVWLGLLERAAKVEEGHFLFLFPKLFLFHFPITGKEEGVVLHLSYSAASFPFVSSFSPLVLFLCFVLFCFFKSRNYRMKGVGWE